MPYSELIKDFSRVRDYMRDFFVYGFKSREAYERKSARTYDNERRRIESWLSDFMAFRQDASGKSVFFSVDSRSIPHNPFYKAWKAASFTKNDIRLHFWLLDILSPIEGKTLPDIIKAMDDYYLPFFSSADPVDESTLRKKLKEYAALGLIQTEKRGKQLVFRLNVDAVDLESWRDAISFFSEENPLGVVGSFLLDKLTNSGEFFSCKHHYLLYALDSGVILDLLRAIRERRKVELELFSRRDSRVRRAAAFPMKIFISTQGGREYLAGFDARDESLSFFRLDSIQKVRLLEEATDFDAYQARIQSDLPYIWGVAVGGGQIEHVEMTLNIAPDNIYVAQRLEREKRGGTVERLDETTWLFMADVYNAQELIPWLRTFIGRIASFSCTNKIVEARFWSDFSIMAEMYGGGGDVI